MLAGIDVSGDRESGNDKFMAIVIGTDDSIDALSRRLGPKPIHMNEIRSRAEKDAVIDKVSFDCKNRVGLCMRIEKKRIFSKIMELPKEKRGFVSKKNLYSAYNGLVWSRARDLVGQFLRLHNCEACCLDFQCDSDCRGFVSDRGWRRANPGPAHALADILAWGNSHEREIEGAVHLDITDFLEDRMIEIFRQWPVSTSTLGQFADAMRPP